MATPQSPGWYDDPEDPQQLRYFDGVVWTRHTTPRSTRPSSADVQQADVRQAEVRHGTAPERPVAPGTQPWGQHPQYPPQQPYGAGGCAAGPGVPTPWPEPWPGP